MTSCGEGAKELATLSCGSLGNKCQPAPVVLLASLPQQSAAGQGVTQASSLRFLQISMGVLWTPWESFMMYSGEIVVNN